MDIVVNAHANAKTRDGMATLLAPIRAKGSAPDFVSVHVGAAQDFDDISHGLGTLGAGALHGATSCLGVMANGAMVGTDGSAMGCFAVWDADGSYGTAMVRLENDALKAGREAVTRALEAAGRSGEAPDLIWLSAVPGEEERVLKGIESVVGENTPIVGGSAADDDVSGKWRVFDGTGTSDRAIVVSVLFPSRPLSTAYQSGYAPARHCGTVTSCEGRTVKEIDHRPAADVYATWTRGLVPSTADAPVPILAQSTLHPLGRAVGSVSDVPFYLLAHPAVVTPDGAIELFAEAQMGERLQLMEGSVESLVSRAGRVASLAARRAGLEAGDVAGALMIYCGGCRLAVGERMDAVARDVNDALGGAPSLGVFTFGEQGPAIDGANHHGNLMISCITFAK